MFDYDDCGNVLTDGRIGGQALLGSQKLSIESAVPTTSQNFKANAPNIFNIPLIAGNLMKQIGVMLLPRGMFLPVTTPDYSPHYNTSNHLIDKPQLVFQSPLDYIGLPPGME